MHAYVHCAPSAQECGTGRSDRQARPVLELATHLKRPCSFIAEVAGQRSGREPHTRGLALHGPVCCIHSANTSTDHQTIRWCLHRHAQKRQEHDVCALWSTVWYAGALASRGLAATGHVLSIQVTCACWLAGNGACRTALDKLNGNRAQHMASWCCGKTASARQ
jgi:hypothetical protein